MSMQPQRIEDAAQLSWSRRTASWLVDHVVTLMLIVIGVVPLIALQDSMPSVSSATWALVAVCIALVTPVLYGVLCFNGRSIGCLVAGTAFFAVVTGRRAHNARMMWVMGHRWMWPVLVIIFIWGLLDSSGPDRLHEQRRVRGVVAADGWVPPQQWNYPPEQYVQQPVQQQAYRPVPPPQQQFQQPPQQTPAYPPAQQQQQMYPPAQQPMYPPAQPPTQPPAGRGPQGQ